MQTLYPLVTPLNVKIIVTEYICTVSVPSYFILPDCSFKVSKRMLKFTTRFFVDIVCFYLCRHQLRGHALLEKLWRISLYVTDVAIAKLYDIMFSQIEGNGQNFRHIQLSNRVIS